MKALIYMTKYNLINRLKLMKRKPVTLLMTILVVLYFLFIGGVLLSALLSTEFTSVYPFLAAMAVWLFYSFFANFAGYAKRKGIIFKPSHSHFIFTAPIHPKLILLYGASYNFLMNLVVSILFVIAGVAGFHLNLTKCILVFFSMCIFETMFEGSIIVFLYANEKLSENTVKWLARGIYLLMAGIVLFVIWYFRTKGMTLGSVQKLIDYPVLQMIPAVGWNFALLRLILLGPTTLNLVCSFLYLLVILLFVYIALKMKCNGEYYEDAAKFADDYAELKARSKRGEMVTSVGKKKTFKQASVNYKASGAKAIFYRQLLEYKKEKWFIFSFMTVCSVLADIICIKFIGTSQENWNHWILLGITLYMVLLTGGYMGKWDKELRNPYLYLIPDSPLKKMWYATLMEHIKAATDGAIFIIPIGIVWKISPFQLLCIWLIFIVLQAVKLYGKVLVDSLLGSGAPDMLKQILRLGIQMGIAGVGAVIGFIAGLSGYTNIVFASVIIYAALMAVLLGILTSSRFALMEQSD